MSQDLPTWAPLQIFLFRYLQQKWGTSWPAYWLSSRRWRSVVGRPPCLSPPRVAWPRPSWLLCRHPPLQLKQLPPLQPHLQEGNAVAAAAVQQRGQKSMLGQPSTRLPWLGKQHLLQQEVPPVLHWALIFHLNAPYAFILLSATIGQHPEYCNGWIPKSFCDLKVIMVAVLQNKS